MSERGVGNAYSQIDHRLLDLADHLEWNAAERIRRLVAADAVAHRIIDMEERTQRAEDLAKECQRQLRSLERQNERLRDEAEFARRRTEGVTP